MKKFLYSFLTLLVFGGTISSQCNNPTFPTISANTNTVCAGGSVIFTRSGTSNIGGFTGYEWIYNTSSNSNCSSGTFFSSISNPAPNNISWSFPTPGVYTVRLRAVAFSGQCANFWPNGYCSFNPITITVYGPPTFSLGSTTRYFCPGMATSITPTIVGGATTFQWRKNNAAVTGATLATLSFSNPTIADAGVYNLVATSSCGTATSAAITLTTITAGNILGVTNALVGTTNVYSTTAVAGLTYSWTQSGTSTITTAVTSSSISVNAPNTTSTYTIELSRAVGTCVATSSVAVNVATCFSLNPTVGLNHSSILCSGNPVLLVCNYVPSGTIVPTLFWSGPNSFTSSIAQPTITNSSALNSGEYTLTIDNGGCPSSKTVSLSVVPSPTVTVSASSTNVCSGSTTTLTASGAQSYQWNPGGGTTVDYIITPSSNGNYSVTGTGSFNCTSEAVISIVVSPNPTITASTNVNLLCPGDNSTLTANGAVTYAWSNGSVGNNVVISPTINTTYTVVGTDANNCSGATTLIQLVTECTGIEKNNVTNNSVRLFPNPAKNLLNVEFETEGTKTMEVFNEIGQVVLTSHTINKRAQIDVSHLPNGLYLIKTQTSYATHLNRVIVNH